MFSLPLSILWFIGTLKYVLFWLYLWQLKDYHVGRFIDHFRTEKGKTIFLNPLIYVKILLLFLPVLFPALFLIYAFESLNFLRQIIQKSFKRPVLTAKTLFLLAVCFILMAIVFYDGVFWILLFDILTPIIVSGVVLVFQPFFVALRNNVLIKAALKLKTMKEKGNLTVIAITGSYGKTSTKEFLATILSKKFRVLSTTEHQNSEIGVAQCILNNLRVNHQFFIAEVGAYNKGKVKEVCLMLKPKIGIVTGVNEQHLALFGSMENLLSAEGGGELAESIEKNGILAVNGDNKYCLELLKKSNHLPPSQEKIYALSNKTVDAIVWSEGISVLKDGVSFVVRDKVGNVADFHVKVLGKQNIQNLLGAILVARELGMSFSEISEAAKHIVAEQAGMVLRKGKHGLNIIDSSYSSNPDGVVADLDYLNIFPFKKVVVMPCLIELGPKSKEIHEKLGRKMGQVCDMAIITSKEYFKDIEKGFKENGRGKILLCDRPKDIYSAITLFCKSGDAVLLEGRVPAGLLNELL